MAGAFVEVKMGRESLHISCFSSPIQCAALGGFLIAPQMKWKRLKSPQI
jgi:hypothetical protein